MSKFGGREYARRSARRFLEDLAERFWRIRHRYDFLIVTQDGDASRQARSVQTNFIVEPKTIPISHHGVSDLGTYFARCAGNLLGKNLHPEARD